MSAVPISERPQIRIFTLADHAAAPPDNKLYLNGAGVDQVSVRTIPGVFPPLALVVRLSIPMAMLGQTLNLEIRVLNEQGESVENDPLIALPMEVSEASEPPQGDNAATLILQLEGFPAPKEERVFFHMVLAGETLGILPIKVRKGRGESDEPDE